MQPVTPAWICEYRGRRRTCSLADEDRKTDSGKRPVPRPAQLEALPELSRLRDEGETAGLVIAATGIGKTYLAALDAGNFGRVLFVAHRLELLEQAERTFRAVRPELRTGFLKGVDALAVHSGGGAVSRQQALQMLTDGRVTILFAVDLFNILHGLKAFRWPKLPGR